MNGNLVFVYGSLKSGFGNNRLLESSEFIGDALTLASKFDMISLGGFPGVVSGGQKRISGEVYSVSDDTLSRLDVLESNGSFYTREKTIVHFNYNKTFPAQPVHEPCHVWIYLLPESYVDRCNSEYWTQRIKLNPTYESLNWVTQEESV